ncbi:hypothetical protein PENTCL1PPCAC_17054, partial [Pristionchus entomophagus]
DDRIVSVFIFSFAIVGLYGNACFILTIIRHKELRTARTLLLVTMCAMHIMVLINFLTSRLIYLQTIQITRQDCFLIYSIPPGNYATSHQLVLYFILVFGIIISLLWPIRYNTIRRGFYVALAQIPCFIFGAGLIIAHLLSPVEEGIVTNQCLFADVFQSSVSNFRIQFSMYLNFLILLLYLVVLTLLCKHQSTRHQKQAVRSVMVLAPVFICTQFVIFTMGYISYFFPEHIANATRAFHKKYSITYALPSYSLTYYVHFCISKEYRKALITTGFCGFLY